MQKKLIDLSGFVNIHGDRINPGSESFRRKPKPKAAPAPRALDATPAGKHMGWQAVGFSQTQVEAARRQLGAEFNEDAWMNGAKPKAARPAPYATESAAAQCADLLRRAGWKRVTVIEVIKH